MVRGVTVVVVAYHRPDSLAVLLERLGVLPVIVVNVGDDPAVRAVAVRATVIVPEGNPGFGAAVNSAMPYVDSDLVCFMNDDVSCGEEQVRVLSASLRAGSQVAVPRVVDPSGRAERTILPLPSVPALLREWVLLPDDPIPLVERFVDVQKWRLPAGEEPVAAASAMCVATYTALLREEPIPEAYFLYWEEAEWFARLHRRGAVVRYSPAAEIVHAGGRRDVRPEKARLLARNAVRCIRRTQGRDAAIVAWPVVVIWQARLVAVEVLRVLALRRGTGRMGARLAGLHAALAAWREIIR